MNKIMQRLIKIFFLVFFIASPGVQSSRAADLEIQSRSFQFQQLGTIKVFELEDQRFGRRIGLRVLSADGTARVYELKALGIGEGYTYDSPEWTKQFQTLVGIEIKIPLGSSSP